MKPSEEGRLNRFVFCGVSAMLAPLWLDPERGSWEEVVRATEEVGRQKWAELAEQRGDWGLLMALYVARRCTGLSLRGLGEAAGHLDYSAVWRRVQRFEQRLAKEKSLAKRGRGVKPLPRSFRLIG